MHRVSQGRKTWQHHIGKMSSMRKVAQNESICGVPDPVSASLHVFAKITRIFLRIHEGVVFVSVSPVLEHWSSAIGAVVPIC